MIRPNSTVLLDYSWNTKIERVQLSAGRVWTSPIHFLRSAHGLKAWSDGTPRLGAERQLGVRLRPFENVVISPLVAEYHCASTNLGQVHLCPKAAAAGQ